MRIASSWIYNSSVRSVTRFTFRGCEANNASRHPFLPFPSSLSDKSGGSSLGTTDAVNARSPPLPHGTQTHPSRRRRRQARFSFSFYSSRSFFRCCSSVAVLPVDVAAKHLVHAHHAAVQDPVVVSGGMQHGQAGGQDLLPDPQPDPVGAHEDPAGRGCRGSGSAAGMTASFDDVPARETVTTPVAGSTVRRSARAPWRWHQTTRSAPPPPAPPLLQVNLLAHRRFPW